MSWERPLSGGCSCGRNQYTIEIPEGSTETAQVFFDDSGAHRKSQANPLTSWLRIPLTWYSSYTISFLPDETHTAIRRTYTSPSQPFSKRHFCGFCGTPLSYWTESPSSEAPFIALTLGSLTLEDLRDLEELGLLPEEELEYVEDKVSGATAPRAGGHVLDSHANEGLPWFDNMVQGSKLGNMKRRGERRKRAGWTVEWEIVEWTEDDDTAELLGTGAKRKLGEIAVEEDDVRME